MKYKIAKVSDQESHSVFQQTDPLTRQTLQNHFLEIFKSKMSESLREQMSNIMSGKNLKATVQSKVEELKERAGLNAFSRKAALEEIMPFQRFSESTKKKIFDFLKGYVERYFGNIAIPAAQEELLNIFKNEGMQSDDVTSPFAVKYISNLIAEEKSKHSNKDIDYGNLGKGLTTTIADPANSDFFHGIMPKK